MSGLSKNPPIIILAGGQGTRLRKLDDVRPKPMVEVCGKPFLYWLVQKHYLMGFEHFIISTGYKADVIESFEWSKYFSNAEIRFVREDKPLGTGGAVRKIFLENNDINAGWVLNGDTFLQSDLPEVSLSTEALYLVLEKKQIFDAEPNVEVSKKSDELFVLSVGKQNHSGQYLDAGAVFLRRDDEVLKCAPEVCSIHELLSTKMKNKKVVCCVVEGTCYDIGTPERFYRFERYIQEYVQK